MYSFYPTIISKRILYQAPVAHLSDAPQKTGILLRGIVQEYKTKLLISLIVFVYLSSFIPVALWSDAPRRRLVVTGDSARIHDEITESSAWFFNALGV